MTLPWLVAVGRIVELALALSPADHPYSQDYCPYIIHVLNAGELPRNAWRP